MGFISTAGRVVLHALSDRKTKRDKEKAKAAALKTVGDRIVIAKQTGHYFSGKKAYQAEYDKRLLIIEDKATRRKKIIDGIADVSSSLGI